MIVISLFEEKYFESIKIRVDYYLLPLLLLLLLHNEPFSHFQSAFYLCVGFYSKLSFEENKEDL